MADLLVDVRSGLRQLSQQKSSSLVAIVTLALGIGVTAAVFSVADATMLRPLPFPNPEQLVYIDVQEEFADGRVDDATASMAEMRALQQQYKGDLFSFVGASGSAFGGSIADGAVPERIRVGHYTEEYLPMFGISPLIGRSFTREDTEPSSPLVALISYGYWQSRYGGGEVIGRNIRLSDQPATIIGVLPQGFNDTTPVVTPLRIPPEWFYRRGSGRLQIYARLNAGVTVEQANQQLARWHVAETSPDRWLRAMVHSRLDQLTSRYRTTVMVFLGAVGLILALAAVNVAGLLLARGSARQVELAVRASLGAGRLRLIRQLFVESIAIVVPALLLGLVLSWLTLDAIVANVPLTMPDNSPVTLNTTVLALTVAALIPATMLFGLLPAFQLSRRMRLGAMVARGARHVGSPLTRRGGQMLIAAEVALAVILVAGAALMIRSFIRISDVELGFDMEDVVTVDILPLDGSPGAQKAYFDELLSRVRTIPGVMSSGLVDNLVLGGTTSYNTLEAPPHTAQSTVFRATPGYLETLKVTARAGRLFTEADYRTGYKAVVINESAARRLFPDGPSVGRSLTRSGRDGESWTVIGVIADMRHGGPLDTRAVGQAQVFLPFEVRNDGYQFATKLVVRRSHSAPLLGDQLRDTARAIGPPVLIERIRSGNDWFTDRVITPRRRMVLLSLLGGLGLLLALVGVVGMTMYAVTRRTTEIGVRMAFGARPADVVGTIVRDAAWPLAIGVAAGIGGAAMTSRVIQSFLFETEPNDPLTLFVVAIALIASGAVAAVMPALRAVRIDPVTCLRTE